MAKLSGTFLLNRATRPMDCADASSLLWVADSGETNMRHVALKCGGAAR
jgi:hypothetical protein